MGARVGTAARGGFDRLPDDDEIPSPGQHLLVSSRTVATLCRRSRSGSRPGMSANVQRSHRPGRLRPSSSVRRTVCVGKICRSCGSASRTKDALNPWRERRRGRAIRSPDPLPASRPIARLGLGPVPKDLNRGAANRTNEITRGPTPPTGPHCAPSDLAYHCGHESASIPPRPCGWQRGARGARITTERACDGADRCRL